MRKGHEYECFISGTDDIIDYVESVYPSDCETWLIGGNHDFSFFKHSQADILKMISRIRPDIKYLGMHKAAFNLGGFEIAMFHGAGAGAASNRLSRTYNNACRDGPKPDLVINGHLHHWNFWPNYGKQNALLVQMACFQGTTIFDTMTDKTPQIGGLIVWRDGAGQIDFKIMEYEETEEDYP